jgi:meso-butanediol dehydrogenase/(S,S)-butanediol dehydrogenase/diacetyl reductase
MTGSTDWQGPVAIVTGAATGIGQAAAQLFHDRGYAVVAVDMSETGLAWINERQNMIAVTGDVSDDALGARMVKTALERFGRLDTVILNAGIARRIDWEADDAMDLFDRIMAVNVRSVVSGIRHTAPAMAARGGGAIVVTASTSGVGGDPERWAYNASKAAVMNLVRAAALDFGARGVRVNAVAPGPTLTPILQGGAATLDHLEALRRPIPLQRMSRPEEQAEAMWFMGTPASSYVTGTTLMCDGGISANAGVFLPASVPLSDVHH